MKMRLGAILIAAALAIMSGVNANAQVSAEHERLITVTGEGTVEGAPDMALITLGVVSEARTAARGARPGTASR